MTRLEAELRRLYLPADGQTPDGDAASPQAWVGRDARVRALVLELAQPASWNALARVWQGLQADLDLPPPAIAVSGSDAHQLWISLAEPVAVARGHAFLEGLRRRYLDGVPRERLALSPCLQAQARQVTRMPPTQAGPERWSAFVAQDLAALFAGEPWLDMAPIPDAQADLLSRLQPAKAADFDRAFEALMNAPAAGAPLPAAPAALAPMPAGAASLAADATDGPDAAMAPGADAPRRFLLAVMNDAAVPLALRVEAAKALLPFHETRRS